MAVVYLLSAAEFKARTPVHGNLDDKFIQQSILACQDLYVTEILGTDLYNKLITDVVLTNLKYYTYQKLNNENKLLDLYLTKKDLKEVIVNFGKDKMYIHLN